MDEFINSLHLRIIPLVLLFTSLFSSYVQAQEVNEDQLYRTFKEILKKDQSNIRKNEIRDSLVQENFAIILDLLESGVNLNTRREMQKKTYKKMNVALIMTFIHTLQYDSKRLLNEESTTQFADYLNQGLLDKRELSIALNAYNKDIVHNRFPQATAYYYQRIENVTTLWGIEIDPLPDETTSDE